MPPRSEFYRVCSSKPQSPTNLDSFYFTAANYQLPVTCCKQQESSCRFSGRSSLRMCGGIPSAQDFRIDGANVHIGAGFFRPGPAPHGGAEQTGMPAMRERALQRKVS